MKHAITLFMSLLLFGNVTVYAQAGKEKTPGLIKSKNYTFFATMAVPQNGAEISVVMSSLPGRQGNITLDPGTYQLNITNDSLVAFLPYYGRAYTPSMDPNDRGIKFTSKDFSYELVPAKKNGWTITMNTKDLKENQRLTLTVSSSGYATLNVLSNNRSYISFNGYVDESSKKQP